MALTPISFVPDDPEPARYLIGADFGQAHDHTALVVVEVTGEDDAPSYDVRAIERLPLKTSYPAVVAHLGRVAAALRAQRPEPEVTVVADYTGCGRPVADMLLEARLGVPLALVTITGGERVTAGDGGWRVPKRDLATAVQVLLQTGRLRIADGLPLARELVQELTGFRVKISLTGHDAYEAGADWRSAPHDDLVLALALACWWGERAGRLQPVIGKTFDALFEWFT